MSLHTLIPVPYEIQQRAWQAAYSLLTDHLERMDPVRVAITADIARRKVPSLTWEHCGDALRIYGLIVERRT